MEVVCGLARTYLRSGPSLDDTGPLQGSFAEFIEINCSLTSIPNSEQKTIKIAFLNSESGANMKCGIITPIGPGHKDAYESCAISIEIAAQNNLGPFESIERIPVYDLEGKLGRSAARNIGIGLAEDMGCDWIFFLDADDLMAEDAFKNVVNLVHIYDAIWGLICEAPNGRLDLVKIRENQLTRATSITEILNTDPFLTLQMGFFVRTSTALQIKFDEVLDTGEDFKFYLSCWQKFRCVKEAFFLFVNVRGNHSIGPRAANGAMWRATVTQLINEVRDLVSVVPRSINSVSNSAEFFLDGPTAVVVAHPDDEVLWAGGLLSRYRGFVVICCSIPFRDPERAICFFNAMRVLGHHPILLPFHEKSADIRLEHLNYLDLTPFKNIITHNAHGEYGHLHHVQLNDYILNNFRGKIYAFGFGKGSIQLRFTEQEQALKMAAFNCYQKPLRVD